MDKQQAIEHVRNSKLRPEIKQAFEKCVEKYHEAFKNLRDR